MIKVKAFRYFSHFSDDLPEYQMERFINEYRIKRDQIIQITSSDDDSSRTLYLCYEE